MKILIAGFGSIGRRHFRNLLALGERDILFLRSHRSTLPEAELAGFPVETDLANALAHRPDAVIVSNPTSLHLDVAIPAAEAGCCLLLEKPVSHSLERVEALQAALARGGGQVLVGYQFRFHPGLRTVSRLLAESAIGRPLSFRAEYAEYLPEMHPWEDYRAGYSARPDLGGGVILTLCHPLDTLRWLLGGASRLWAFAARLNDLDLQVEDTAEIGLQFENGATGSVHLDYNRRPPAHTLKITGTHGTLRWDNADGAVKLYQPTDLSPQQRSSPSPAPLGREDPVPPSPASAGDDLPLPPSLPYQGREGGPGGMREVLFPSPPNFERNDLFLAEMRHFLAVARGEEQPLCTLDDGLAALRLALAAHESAREGRLIQLE